MVYFMNGPMNPYQAHKKLEEKPSYLPKRDRKQKSPPAQISVNRHIDILTKTIRPPELITYKKEEHWSHQTKVRYGLSIYGFLRCLRIEGGLPLRNFGSAIRTWLKEDRFQFFVPNEEALKALDRPGVEFHLSRLCQLIANMFGEAEDFLEDLGYYEPEPDQIITLAVQFAAYKYRERFIKLCRFLCSSDASLPTLVSRLRSSIEVERENLNMLETQIFGPTPRTDNR
jgi:hypothetical protein